MDPFARQRLLSSVGDAGQERISAATYVASSLSPRAAEVEKTYLERAGATRFTTSAEPSAAFSHAHAFRHTEARELAEGAWRALMQLKAALEHSP